MSDHSECNCEQALALKAELDAAYGAVTDLLQKNQELKGEVERLRVQLERSESLSESHLYNYNSDREALCAIVAELLRWLEPKFSDWELECHGPQDLLTRARAVLR